MIEFIAGDRVRVRGRPETARDTGRTGTVVGVERDDVTGAVVLCQVRLDAGPRYAFLADELEPESG